MLKPNVMGGRAPPITTDPRVVQALATLVGAEGPASIAEGDMSAVPALPTRPHLEQTGIAMAARAVRAEVLAFDAGEWVEVDLPHVQYTKPYTWPGPPTKSSGSSACL